MRKRSLRDVRHRYGPWALVTGAAQGLGAAFAAECAMRGLHVVLVDKLAREVQATADRLASQHGVQTRAIAVDLGGPDPWAELAPALADLEIGLLVNNAGRGPVGRFLAGDLSDHLDVLRVNCRAPLELSYRLGTAMRDRGRGGIVFVASLSGLNGTALVAHYAGTKAWNLVFGESLWTELRDEGVDVLSVAAGPTRTPAWDATRPDPRTLAARIALSPHRVAATAMNHLGRAPVCIPGWSNRLAAALTQRVLPRRSAIEFLARNMARLYPDR